MSNRIKKELLAVIPARGGSKRVHKKNIKLLGNKPLVSWAIDSAKDSDAIDEILVSTDSIEILEICKSTGYLNNYVRPANLATDTANQFLVMQHAIEHYLANGVEFKNIVLLQPTSPFRTGELIDRAYQEFKKKKCDALISVTLSDTPRQWTNFLPEDNSLANFIDERYIGKQSQELGKTYKFDGSLYFYNVKRLLKEKKLIFKNNIYAFILQGHESLDIDNQLDLDFANFLIKSKNV